MKTTIKVLSLLIILTSCKKNEEKMEPSINWTQAQTYYINNLEDAIRYLDSLKAEGLNGNKSKHYFALTRASFKKAEPYASYLNPEVGHRANGPALPIYKEDTGKITSPIGLQKIEESIYEQETSIDDFNEEIYVTKGLFYVLKKTIEKRDLNPQRFFIATHQQLFRIVSLAISGFDTPVSHLGINETKISLESLQKVYSLTIQAIIQNKDKSLDSEFQNNLSKAIQFIEKNNDFDTFDRFTFTRDYMNPITRNWVNIRKVANIWEPIDTEPFNFDAPTFFENNTFNVSYFTPATNLNPSEKQIKLGEKLFSEPKLSANQDMACISCHIPSKGYADGLALNLDNKGNPLQRNTPTLINTAFQKSFFLDGRSNSLLDQISLVFTNDKEFNTNVHEFSDAILTDSTYVKLFKEAYGSLPKNNKAIIKAISSYIATLNGFNSKFDKNIRGETNNFTEEEKLGYNIFMGKALCATCHFIPLTNGTVPPFFNETEKEVIGVPETAENKTLDNDLGFYWKFKEDLHKGMFKTPSVRNVTLTEPYMHNGVYNTLEAVVDFYNLGGGGGLGFDLPHQTLPFDNLNLTAKEQASLVAFMKTLTDDQVNKRSY
ncbi:cytochrome c peroxidase [Siansivirga zeaxanthinifaciens]|uniref:Cytochrome C peroxidase n=1 Tax=Siansivirga zeaxanthinifaciens CC-SAMT-1 TaxID=1454006 RepID=A0A0C5WA65_9FLAO|nr:cytochrome c peroxidase [Siansivirga zeaxanthinifaciens]AJR04028.1 cytochrome C peroxidase [Siansivirga zeaxanthinifaciens CC-SAMT-1]